MPIVDGLTSTKMIRSYEKTHPYKSLSKRRQSNGRIPIFAVSASLVEEDRQKYIDAGFDGWVLKPIDFKRLGVLLSGIVEEETRESCLYQAGEWERGGWFRKLQPEVYSSSTVPSSQAPVFTSAAPESYPTRPQDDPTDRERERLNGLENEAVCADSFPENPGQSGDIQQANEGESTE